MIKLKHMGKFLKIGYVADHKFEIMGALKEIIFLHRYKQLISKEFFSLAILIQFDEIEIG